MLEHPQYPWFKELGLRWYTLPSVCEMVLDLGGMHYRGIPFNGFYMSTESGARLQRRVHYDKLPIVADRLGLDRSGEQTLGCDRALVELNLAVVHSYRKRHRGRVRLRPRGSRDSCPACPAPAFACAHRGHAGLIAARDAQLRYQAVVPYVDVTIEQFFQWEDWYRPFDEAFAEASDRREAETVRTFHDMFTAMRSHCTDRLLPLEQLVQTTAWKRCSGAARTAGPPALSARDRVTSSTAVSSSA